MLRVRLMLVILVTVLAGPALWTSPAAAQQIELTQRADIIDVQERLKNLGWYHGAIDGIVGSGTRSAARAYRRSAGLPPSSSIDKELQLHLHFINPELRAGGSRTAVVDPDVRKAQELLKLLGYYPGNVDGISGPQTRGAVEAFRRVQGLSAGSRVDTQLLDQLDAELARRGRG